MVICDCGSIAIIRTSWTSTNPGRRFYCCSIKGSKCRFLGWVDGPMCPRSIQIIPGLLRSKNEVEAALKSTASQARKWKLMCFISWVAFAMYYVLV
ncbi:hypothetical protein OSB04_un001533 [Centaurea solstitialis]|uniref:GRF-type domain-containing protein n=1 Tax=Centaurea solstitialis TaxID=347529 RepID=A0AA38W1M4_9ASTR|nr:hypothetical protein OSB04_un001533 [Centaurea solstitialis]